MITIGTQLALAPEVGASVPWDAQLLGLGKMAGQPMLFWKTEAGVGERVPRIEVSFYMFVIGDPLPEDHGDFIGTFEWEVDVLRFQDGKQTPGKEKIDVLIFRKDEVKAN